MCISHRKKWVCSQTTKSITGSFLGQARSVACSGNERIACISSLWTLVAEWFSERWHWSSHVLTHNFPVVFWIQETGSLNSPPLKSLTLRPTAASSSLLFHYLSALLCGGPPGNPSFPASHPSLCFIPGASSVPYNQNLKLPFPFQKV